MMKNDDNHEDDGLFVFIYSFFFSLLSLTVKRNTHVYYPSHVIRLHCIFVPR
jgi:hypothetical protein